MELSAKEYDLMSYLSFSQRGAVKMQEDQGRSRK
jgi:hypothetical protein